MIIFRKATPKDFEGLCRLRKELADDPEDKETTEYALYQEKNDRIWIQKCLHSRERIKILIAKDTDGICAHAIVCFEKVPKRMKPYVTYHKKARLVHLYVSRKKRRQGIGEELTKYTLNYLKKNGTDFVDLECYMYNDKAEALYRKIGFKDIYVLKRLSL